MKHISAALFVYSVIRANLFKRSASAHRDLFSAGKTAANTSGLAAHAMRGHAIDSKFTSLFWLPASSLLFAVHVYVAMAQLEAGSSYTDTRSSISASPARTKPAALCLVE